MAYFSGGTSNGYITINLAVTEVSTSIENNTSTVSYTLSISKSGSSTEKTWGQCSYAVNVGGNEDSGSASITVYPGDSTSLLGGTVTIPHNSDGTMSISCSGSISGKINGSCSGTMTLTTIPRASSITVPTFTLGQAGTITINRYSENFTHTLQVVHDNGDPTETIAWRISDTSFTWTPKLDYAKEVPNSGAWHGTIVCTTLLNGNVVGTYASAVWCGVPWTVLPKINSVTLSDTESAVTNIVGSGNFVQGKSKIRVVISGSGDDYGSTIASSSVTANGVTYSGHDVTLPVIGSASFTITASVTDTRGRTVTKNVAVSQLPYYAPAVSAFSCDRCTSKGADDDNGDYCKVKYTYKAYPLTVDSENKNTITAKIQARQHRDTTGSWTDLITIADASSETDDFSATDVSNYSTVEVSADYQWDIKFTITDSFGVASEVTIMLHSADVIMDFKSDGTGIAFSKTAELSDTADFGDWAVKAGGYLLGETALDPVIASGTSGIWNYVKYSSGLAICTARRTQGGVNVGSTWGNIYATAGNIITPISYPFAFTSVPMECVAVTTGPATMSAGIITGQTTNTTTTTGAYDLIRGTQAWWDGYIQYVVMGWWK